jgi:hypothetical protein
LNNNVAEFATLAVAIEPVVEPEPTLTVPFEIVNTPVNVFAPVSVSVPVPCLVNFPAVPEMMPAKVVEALPAVVSVLVNVPAPRVIDAAASLVVDVSIDATVSLNVARSNVPAFPTTTADESEMRSAAANAIVPVETVVEPVYVFTPDSVSVPVPLPPLVRPTPPDITPEIVAVVEFATCTVEAAAIATVPDNSPAAVKYTAPAEDAPVPEIVNGSADVTAPAISNVAPELTVVAPAVVPNAVAFEIFTVPAEIVVAPV